MKYLYLSKKLLYLIFIFIWAHNSYAQQALNLISPQILPDNRVTISLYAPMATDVQLVGGWMSNPFIGEKMNKGDNGVWTYTTAALKEDMYLYSSCPEI